MSQSTKVFNSKHHSTQIVSWKVPSIHENDIVFSALVRERHWQGACFKCMVLRILSSIGRSCGSLRTLQTDVCTNSFEYGTKRDVKILCKNGFIPGENKYLTLNPTNLPRFRLSSSIEKSKITDIDIHFICVLLVMLDFLLFALNCSQLPSGSTSFKVNVFLEPPGNSC